MRVVFSLSIGTKGGGVYLLSNARDDILKGVWHPNGYILQVYKYSP